MTRLGIAAFALVSSVIAIRQGGAAVQTGSVVVYAAISCAVCVAMAWRLPRLAPHSDLVALESAGWRVGSMLTGAMLLGFGVVALLPAGNAHDVASRYVDPVLVIITSLLVLPVPVRLLRTTMRELLEMAPAAEIAEPAEAAIRQVCRGHGLDAPVVRLSKTGGKLYVEINHLVDAGTWDVSQIDVLRKDLRHALESDSYDVWLNVDLSCDPRWVS